MGGTETSNLSPNGKNSSYVEESNNRKGHGNQGFQMDRMWTPLKR